MPSWFGPRLEGHDKRLSPFAQRGNDVQATARPSLQTRLKRIVSHESDATATNKSAKRSRNQVKSNLVAGMAEFVGTFMFLFFAFAGNQIGRAITSQTANEYDPSVLILISLCFGFSLMANAWAFYRVSGGLFNPAVTFALYLIDGLAPVRAIVICVAQLLGGLAAAGLVSALLPGKLDVSTTLRPGTSVTQGLFIEVFLTAELVFVIIMLAAEKHKSTYIAPIGIGIAFFVTELVGIYLTGGSLNPARSLGPAVVAHSFPGYHWIYWVGPGLGAMLASGFFLLLKKLRYYECNPEADLEDMEKLHPAHEPYRCHVEGQNDRDRDDATEARTP